MGLSDVLSKEELKVDIVFLEKPNDKLEKEILSLIENARKTCSSLIVNYFSAPHFEYRVPSPLVTVDDREKNISLRGYGQDGLDLIREIAFVGGIVL